MIGDPWARAQPRMQSWLHEAARVGDLGMIRLIAKGVSAKTGTTPQYPAPTGPTPIEIASRSGKSDSVELLRANGGE